MLLKTYEILTDTELKDQIIKQQVIFRLENWLEHCLGIGREDADGCGESLNEERAIGNLKWLLLQECEFAEIQKKHELITVDMDDEPEEFRYQLKIIKEWANY